MSKTPLPPPPGFMRQKKELGASKRYVYPFVDSEAGHKAQILHEWFLADEEKRWRRSALYKRIVSDGRAAIKATQPLRKRVSSIEAAKIGITIVSTSSPVFLRRNPLDQVWEHVRHQPRYFMKIDVSDAFGCVYPGFHDKFPRPVIGDSTDLFSWAQHGTQAQWDGWPFFHPGTGGLIQGAPSSPLLFEKACVLSGLDELLRATAVANNATVTRYVDDIVFSRYPWDDRPFGDRIFKTLKKKIADCGFAVNDSKTRRVDTRFKPIEFLGVRVLRNRVALRPSYFERLSTLGYISQGHLDWISQIEQARDDLQIMRAQLRVPLRERT